MQLHVLITNPAGEETRYDNVSHIKITPGVAFPGSHQKAFLTVILDFANGSQSERYASEFKIIHAEGV